VALRRRGDAKAAEATFNTLRDMPDAPASFLSVDVCEVVEKVDDPDSGATPDLPAARFRQIRNTTTAFPTVVTLRSNPRARRRYRRPGDAERRRVQTR
jgi:hypothetical protein